MENNKSILIFGAGRIGRSFIGQLFGAAGYEIVFSDIDLNVVQALNARKSYPVVIKDKVEQTILVQNVRAISGINRERLAQEISSTSLIAVSVGKNALEKIIPVIAEGLKMRYLSDLSKPLDIIIAENMRSGSEFLKEHLTNILPDDYPFERLVGLVETSIGKMVPIMTREEQMNDPLLVYAEQYNDLILDKKGFKGPIPDVKGISPKENIKAWVDRKLFIHNLGHATAAYYGFYRNPETKYIYEVLDDPEVYRFTKEVMVQAANVLAKIYPDDFTISDLWLHIDDLLSRFQNKALKDTIFRVGQDRIRKLGADDRFVGIIRLAEKQNMSYEKILQALVYAFYFEATDENGCRHPNDSLFDNYKSKGFEFVLQEVCGFDSANERNLVDEFKDFYDIVNQN